MKRSISLRILIAATFAAVSVPAPAEDKGKLPAQYADVAHAFTDLLALQHVSKRAFDDTLSEKAWERLLDEYDEEHVFFLQEDIQRFEPMRRKFDDAIREYDLSSVSDMERVYRKRVGECVVLATNLLLRIAADPDADAGLRSKHGGDYCYRGEDLRWPESPESRLKRWEDKLRGEMIDRLVASELDGEGKGWNVTVAGIAHELAEEYQGYLDALEKPDDEGVFQQFLSAVGNAYDPHTDYLNPARKRMFEAMMSLSLCGIGISIDSRKRGVVIRTIQANGPAGRDGRLKPGDRIVGVGEKADAVESVRGLSVEQVLRKVAGKEGTKVVLEVVAASGDRKPFRIELVRETIKLDDEAAKSRVETVSLGGKSYKLGYLKLSSFYGNLDMQKVLAADLSGGRSATADVAAELKTLGKAGVQGLVFDLRGNGGGRLDEALTVASLFVGSGPVAQVPMFGYVQTMPALRADEGGGIFRKPLVVLIDRKSASASELVAGLLKDRGRAVVAGDKQTHGKGSMQIVLPLGMESGEAHVTQGFFYRITGASTQVKGVTSDILLPSPFNEIRQMGEGQMPNALAWTSVPPAKHRQDWDMPCHVPELERRSAARRSANAGFWKHLERVRHVGAAFNRTTLPLDYATAKEQKRRDRRFKVDMIDRSGVPYGFESDVDVRGKDGMPVRGKDVVLDESLNILSDLVELTGGAEMPPRKKKK
ncbi:MAG: carboxy terminal-processing peptidase [Kiritimatiellae bacterium]|nr:carboxy terminal-processing peptidase [Kiritimatiellia bacterium]